MSIFPGNILVIDDQFNLVYLENEPEDPNKKLQWENFKRLRMFFDNNGICYSVITETTSFIDIESRLKKYQNIRLLVLDLDLNNSGDVEEEDELMIKMIVLKSLELFGYFFLAINSSYSTKWIDIRDEIIKELEENAEVNRRKIHFLQNFCIGIDKSNHNVEEVLLKLLSDKFSNELITQFEAKLNSARDLALSPFMDFTYETWEHVYRDLKKDIDSREHINLTLNNLLFGLLKQHMIDTNYTPPNVNGNQIDNALKKSIIKSFNYLYNKNKHLDSHPVWTGNLYYSSTRSFPNKYLLVITPECDIAQAKGGSFTVVPGFELIIPDGYNPNNFVDGTLPPEIIRRAGKTNDGKWKKTADIKQLYLNGIGYYPLYHAGINEVHLIFDLRYSYQMKDFSDRQYKLQLRVNEPVITDITDKYSALFNRKGIPKFTPVN